MTAPPPSFRRRKSVMALLETLRPDPHFPLSAMVEIADRCNEACVHCYQVHGQKGELSTEEWKGVFDDLADMGVFLLTISGGEATLRKDLLELIAHARSRSFAVKLYTNGLTMTAAVASQLGALGVMEVQISLYSHDATTHDEVTRVPGSFERTVEAARHLRAAGIAVVLKTPLMTMNASGIDDYVRLCVGIDVDYQFDPALDPREDGDAGPEQYRLDDAAYVRVRRHPTLAPRGAPPRRSPEDSICGACSSAVHVEANGELRPCTQLQVPVGHVQDGIQTAWRDDPTGRQIQSVTWADLPGCRACDLRHFCSRCFAVARVEGIDALSAYPSACRTARLNYEVFAGEAPDIRAGDRSDVELGPYREVSTGHFVTRAVELSQDDLARRETYEWLRAPAPLVQLRRRTVESTPRSDPD